MRGLNLIDEAFVRNNGSRYTKEEVHAMIKSEERQRKERQITAATVVHSIHMQVPSPESSGGPPKVCLTGGVQPGPVSAAHMNELSGHGAGTKRSLFDGDNAYKDGRGPKAVMASKDSNPQSSRAGGATTGLRKIVAKKQPKSQDATPQKRPRGRPPKGSNTNGIHVKKALAVDMPAVPAPAPTHSRVHASEIIDFTQPDKTQPVSNLPHPRNAEAIELPNGPDIGQPAIHKFWLHSSHRNGVSMADLEFGSSIRDNMINYLSELESRHRTTVSRIANTLSAPSFTDNTMSTEHAITLGLPTGFDMLPVLNKVRDLNYDGYTVYSSNGNGDLSGEPPPVRELSNAEAEIHATPFKGFGVSDPSAQPHWGLHRNGPKTKLLAQIHIDDLPDETQVTEESALLQWGMLQQAKNRESDDNWGADMNGKSTWH
jgi:hypothetical protein